MASRKLSQELCELVQDYGLVSFMPLAVEVRLARLVCLHARSVRVQACRGRRQARSTASRQHRKRRQQATHGPPSPPPKQPPKDKESLQAVLQQVDKANGALYASLADPALAMPPEFLYGTAHR